MGIKPTFNAEKYEWIKSQLSLDLLDVDEEIIRLPVILQEASEYVSQAIEIREAAKGDLERAVAQLAHELRTIPLPGSGKFRSETTIDKEVPLSSVYTEKVTALSIARLDASLWQSIVDALRVKSSSIRVAADLITTGYLTSNSIYEKRRKDVRGVRV